MTKKKVVKKKAVKKKATKISTKRKVSEVPTTPLPAPQLPPHTVEEIKTNAGVVVVHVTMPQEQLTSGRVAQFAERLRREFPEDCRILVTSPEVKIKVNRPRSVKLSFSGCTISNTLFEDKIKDLLDKHEADIVEVVLSNCKIN